MDKWHAYKEESENKINNYIQEINHLHQQIQDQENEIHSYTAIIEELKQNKDYEQILPIDFQQVKNIISKKLHEMETNIIEKLQKSKLKCELYDNRINACVFKLKRVYNQLLGSELEDTQEISSPQKMIESLISEIKAHKEKYEDYDSC